MISHFNMYTPTHAPHGGMPLIETVTCESEDPESVNGFKFNRLGRRRRRSGVGRRRLWSAAGQPVLRASARSALSAMVLMVLLPTATLAALS